MSMSVHSQFLLFSGKSCQHLRGGEGQMGKRCLAGRSRERVGRRGGENGSLPPAISSSPTWSQNRTKAGSLSIVDNNSCATQRRVDQAQAAQPSAFPCSDSFALLLCQQEVGSAMPAAHTTCRQACAFGAGRVGHAFIEGHLARVIGSIYSPDHLLQPLIPQHLPEVVRGRCRGPANGRRSSQ